MTQISHQERKFTGKHMLAIMIAFYAVIIVVNLILVFFATQSWTGLITKNSYAENQVFDKKTSQIEAGQQNGPDLLPSYKDNIISLHVKSAPQNQAIGTIAQAVIGRVVHERDDRTVQFTRKSDTLYEASHALAPGRWELKLKIELPSGDLWQKSYILLVRDTS